MRNYISIIFLLLLFFNCTNRNKNAKQYLAEATQLYKESNFHLAKLKIDSIKTLYPKAFEQIKDGMKLMNDIRLAENKRNIHYCDSMLIVNNDKLQALLTQFKYVKDEKYEEIGAYHPLSFHQNFALPITGLRSGVTEKGVLFLESVLVGSSIRHTHIKISTSDNNFAETLPVTTDGLNYRFNSDNNTYEIVRYSGKDENELAKFIFLFQEDNLTLSYIGNKTIVSKLSDKTKKGISLSFELASLLQEKEQLRFEKEKSQILINYLQSKN